MKSLKNVKKRIKDRAYLASTAILYSLMAALFFAESFAINQSWPISLTIFVDTTGLAILFSVAVILCVVAIGSNFRNSTRLALYFSTVLALGMAVTFFVAVVAGQFIGILPMIIWAYVAFTHMVMVRYHDWSSLDVIEQEIEMLKNEIGKIKERK